MGTGKKDGIDIFIDLYLKKHPGAAELQFGRQGHDLEEQLAREEESYEELMSEPEGTDEEKK